MIARIVYSSEATEPSTVTELEKLLTELRSKNRAQDVTGVLVYVDGVFMQVLEGDRNVVNGLMLRIRSDYRHCNVTVFYDADVEQRAFQRWRMAYVRPSLEEAARWAALDGTGSITELVAHLHAHPKLLPDFLVNIVGALGTD